MCVPEDAQAWGRARLLIWRALGSDMMQNSTDLTLSDCSRKR